MSASNLLEFDAKIKEKMYAQLNLDQRSIDENLQIVRQWVNQQPHIPHDMSDNMLNNMLILAKGNIEKLKRKLELYYSIRAMFPQYFKETIKTSKEMKESLKILVAFPLPKQLDCCRILASTIFNNDIKVMNPRAAQAVTYQILDVLFEEDCSLGAHFLMDARKLKIAHLSLLHLDMLRSMRAVVEKMGSNRLRSIQMLCNDQVLSHVLSILKKMYSKKIIEKMKVHSSLESLHKEIPPEYLPKEFGGHLKPLLEMGNDWYQKLIEYDSHIKKLNSFKMDLSLRPKELTSDLFDDVQGTFKNLQID